MRRHDDRLGLATGGGLTREGRIASTRPTHLRVATVWLMLFALAWLSMLALPAVATAQGEWVRRIDRDNNGYVEPDEISDRARRYLEEFAIPYGLSLTRPNSVEKLEQAARLFAQHRESSERRQAEAAPPSRPFGPTRDEALVPGFGLPEVKFPYTQADLEEADQVLHRWDRNRNGRLDPEEIEEARWQGPDPRDFDLNQDGNLSRLELAQRYARQRIVQQRTRMTLGTLGEVASRREDDEDRSERWSRQRAGSSQDGDRGSRSLATSIVARYDFNRNDQLDPQEMASVGIPISRVDYDRNGAVDAGELSRYLFEVMELEASRNQEAIPTWFFERDADGDQQVTMAEFAQEWDERTLNEFASYDHNQDGIITMNEVVSSSTVAGGQFVNNEAQVLLPRSTAVSEIEVGEDFLIGELKVQLSISHTYTEQLDGYLIGPDGQRIELFTGVGGSDDHFDKTIFDDNAQERITRARAPFSGSFQPEALEKRQPGLKQYQGKNLKGTWQLMIRASRSERSGVLHGWSLLVQPDRAAVDDIEAAAERLRQQEASQQEAGMGENGEESGKGQPGTQSGATAETTAETSNAEPSSENRRRGNWRRGGRTAE